MLRFIARRIFIEAVPTLLVLITLTFFMVRLAPGGPFSREQSASPEVIANLEAYYGMSDPLVVQYLRYLGSLVRGDLGPSYKYMNQTVNEIIATSFPVSLQLGSLALLFALVVGIPAGIVASMRPHSALDVVPMAVATAGICLPTFVLGPLLVLFFSLHLEWLSVAGWESWQDRILPVVTLGFGYAAYIARLMRGSMLEVLNQDYIRTARAKGLAPRIVLLRHALRGGLLPVISFLGPAAAGLITGSFVVETIFHIPGMGRYVVDAAANRDYLLVQGVVLFFGALLVLFNLLADVAVAWLNPKLREAL